MSFIEQNEYLLSEIDYYHEQICNRLSGDDRSGNYHKIWDAVCFQLNWQEFIEKDKPKFKLFSRFAHQDKNTAWLPFDSPVLHGGVAILKEANFAYRTLFDYHVYTTGLKPWEAIAHGVHELAETLLVLRFLPYLECFIDVGARNGYFSFMAAQHGSLVTAFEPAPAEYQMLLAGAESNGFNVGAPCCTISESAEGPVFYLEDEGKVRRLLLAAYRSAATLIKLETIGFQTQLLKTAGEWLTSYDAPAILINTDIGTTFRQDNQLAFLYELESKDYSIYAFNDGIEHGGRLITPISADDGAKENRKFLALPPMAKDLVLPLNKAVDMRIFTPAGKLESLYYFVKNWYEGC
jgi:FkbM family methyltransferase